MKKGTTISICFLLLVVSWIPTISSDESVFANILYVGGIGPGNYTTIRDAINDAGDGDTVFVYSGYYFETSDIDKQLNMIGEDKYNTIIDGGGRPDVFYITHDYVNVSGFTFQGCQSHFGGCCLMGADFCTITDNIFMDNVGCGVLLLSSHNNIISNNIIINNTEGGIFVGGNNNVILINQINDNGLYGIEIDGLNNLIYHNNLIDNFRNAHDWGTNIWYNSSLMQGNYYSDYTGVDVNEDGIGDIPYNISGGSNQDLYPLMNPITYEDILQNIFDRGFPIRHAIDGNWAAAQSFIPTLNTLSSMEIYLRKFGTPEFNLTVELRTDDPQGTLIDTLVFTPEETPSSWEWFPLDFTDTTVIPGTDYFIVCPPDPSGVTTSFGYEWGYAFGNQYDDGAFWFTRDGGGLWRDLPTMYEFVFRTYGYT